MSIGAIQLNRFDNELTRLYLQGRVGQELPLFSVSNNNFTTQNDQLNPNTVFTLPSNEVSASYDVNQAPNRGVNQTPFFTLDTSGNFLRNGADINQAQGASDLNNFNRPLAFDFTANRQGFLTELSAGTVPTTAPSSPEAFADQLRRYEISDFNYDALVASGEFAIPRNGQGFRVFTNPDGTINRIETDISFQSRQQTFGATDDNFLLPNRTDITQGAMFTVNPVAPQEIDPNQPSQSLRPVDTPAIGSTLADTAGLNNRQLGNPLLQGGLGLDRLNLFGPDKYTALFTGRQDIQQGLPGLTPTNPVLQQLLAKQPVGDGVALQDVNSPTVTQEALQLAAANKSGYGVDLSSNTKQTIQQLTTNQLLQNDVYAAAQRLGADLSATMPMVPTLPAPVRSGNENSLIASSYELAQAAGSGVDDALSKKGSGGSYFNFFGGNTSSGMDAGTGSFSEGGGPFSGSSQSGGSQQQQDQQQQRRQRRPLSYQA